LTTQVGVAGAYSFVGRPVGRPRPRVQGRPGLL